jgi:hypothetical protein
MTRLLQGRDKGLPGVAWHAHISRDQVSPKKGLAQALRDFLATGADGKNTTLSTNNLSKSQNLRLGRKIVR